MKLPIPKCNWNRTVTARIKSNQWFSIKHSEKRISMYFNVHNSKSSKKKKKKERKTSFKKYRATTHFTFKEVNQSQGTCIKCKMYSIKNI